MFNARGIAGLGGALILAACTTGGVTPPGSRFIVVVPKSAFYKYGPAQSFGPDFQLTKGQKVTMLERTFGYSRVTTDEGVTGYISSDEVIPAPPEPPPPKATPKPKSGGGRSWFSGAPKHSDVEGTPGSPLFDVNDVPAPLPTEPEPKKGSEQKKDPEQDKDRGSDSEPEFRF